MPSPLAPDRAGDRRALLLLVLLAAIAFWPAAWLGFVWDDDDYVTHNPVLRSAGGLFRIWFEPTSLPQYYPLVHTSFWLEFRLWGDHPLGYHVDNVLLQLAAAWQLRRLLLRLAVPGALLAAALFLVHPVQVESVAWVTERKNVLSLTCALLAANAWFGTGARRPWVATAWFAAALASKTVVATLPAALLVLAWWRHGRLDRRDLLGTLPWLGLGLVAAATTVWLEAGHVGASGQSWQLAGAERLLVAGRAPWHYLATLLWPFGICFNYPRWSLDVADPWQWLPVAGTLAVVVAALVWRRRLGRGPAAVTLLYLGLLSPALGFFDVYPFRFAFVADHFQYHATTVACAAAAGLAARRLPPRVFTAGASTLALGLAVLTNLQTREYRDLETLWRATLARNPQSMLAMSHLGGLLLQRGDLAAARPLLQRCLELHPDSHEALANLGQLAHLEGDLSTARERYERTLALHAGDLPALRNLAELHLQQGRAAAALPLLQQALSRDADFYDARVTLAAVLDTLGRHAEAVAEADWVLRRTPTHAPTRLLAAKGLLQLGRDAQAAQNAACVLRSQPTLRPAQDVFVRAFARELRQLPASAAAAAADRALVSGQLDAATLRPRLAAELRSLGASAHADALQR